MNEKKYNFFPAFLGFVTVFICDGFKTGVLFGLFCSLVFAFYYILVWVSYTFVFEKVVSFIYEKGKRIYKEITGATKRKKPTYQDGLERKLSKEVQQILQEEEREKAKEIL